jgi:hypothetical protein
MPSQSNQNPPDLYDYDDLSFSPARLVLFESKPLSKFPQSWNDIPNILKSFF